VARVPPAPPVMKAAVLHAYDDIRIEDRPVPDIGPGEALVRMRASGICSGDVMPWYIEKKAPLVLGHEPVGEIVELGPGAKGLSRGDRVFIHHHAPCGACAACARGDHVQCPAWRGNGLDPGGIAEFVRVRARHLASDTLRLPEAVPDEGGVLVEPLACVLKGIGRSGLRPADTALVMGLGTMGQLHVAALRARGVRRIIAADRIAFRLERAARIGADRLVDLEREDLAGAVHRHTADRGAETVFVCPASVEAMEQALDLVAPGGTVLLFSPAGPGRGLTLDVNRLYFRDIRLVTSYSAGPDDTRAALAMLEAGAVPVGEIVTHRFPIERTAEAFRLTAAAGASLKVVIRF